MRHIFSSFGGNLGETGSVSNYLYDYKGQLILKTPTDFESFELTLLDTEAEDYQQE
jgi:transcriptional/translational regulatory protein YebC/TACO1